MTKKKRTLQDLDLAIAIEIHLIGLTLRDEPWSSRVQADRILETVATYMETGKLPAGKPWEFFAIDCPDD
jgi:hypothetical protein